MNYNEMVLSNKIYDNTEVNVKYSDPKTFSQIDRSTNYCGNFPHAILCYSPFVH